MSTGAREWVTMAWLFWVFERSGLCFLGMFAKGNRGERERKDCQIESFKVLVTVTYSSVSKRQKRGEAAEASDMQVCKNDVVWGPLSPQKPNTAPFWGPLNPQKPTRRRFWRLIFPPKAQHGTVLGPLSLSKPTRRRFGDKVSHQISHGGPAHFLSFLT